MNDATSRFLDVYEYLKTKKIVKNSRDFANELNISTSLFTEISKKRTNAGMIPIQNLIKKYKDIDANWLLTGEGSMIKNSSIEININYKELAEARLEIISLKDEKIEWLNKELKKKKGL
ncbi:hypothetical protein SAMN05444671_3337 [Flavobacterium sp. CF108]|uniref:hypothetical protein n=1 Tax=unclassified Flavobacterium TaxID=196869 RepID=UPI0008C761CF|nr:MULTISPECIES: hypothetical protein [unclassified Flavobacterium]SEO39693.1 hypothetical protein SAMN04487978_2771 [Flavobacterium sp. fv08]SHH66319.1 hypothetical protein SAMN05444671_3337 [Flavobacterium sp. CF108]